MPNEWETLREEVKSLRLRTMDYDTLATDCLPGAPDICSDSK